jgi:uncharacterized protein (TIGR03067 family)
MRTLFCFLLVVGLSSAADEPKEDAKSDQDKIQGTWVCESAVRDGESLPADGVKSIKITFKGDKATMLAGGDKKKEATFKLDPGKKPREITLSPTDGGKEQKGIYAFDGESLKICAGEERPPEFTAKEGTKRMLMVLKRDQAK